LDLPEVETIRRRIQLAKPKEAKYCLMIEYLCCARISEIIGEKCPSDATTNARGISGQDIKQTVVRVNNQNYDAVVLTIKTAKRHGEIRKIALPLNKEYEPFTEQLFNYVRQFGNDKVFPFTRQKAWEHSKEIFSGLEYPIKSYRPFKDGKPLELVPEHMNPFRTHGLRHLRASELLDVFDFDPVELSLYGGWTLRSMVGVGSALSRYTHLKWKRYFPKLLQERV
jgi:integrase